MGIHEQILAMGRRAAAAARAVAALGAEAKNRILQGMADGIASRRDSILAANARDLEAGRSSNLTAAFMDRLALDPERIEAMAGGVRDVARLPDLIGEEITATRRPNGLLIRKVRVPLGVVAMIYESRPNVTADAAALCFKAGNGVILRGGSEAAKSNAAILEAMLEGGASAGLPEDAIQLVATTDRRAVDTLLQMDQYIDLVIPRGGESLIRAVTERSTVPVLKHYKGVCHVYVDRAADPEMALEIVLNSKCQRPGVCNAMETLLVHAGIAGSFLPRAEEALAARGVELRGCPETRRLIPSTVPAREADWSQEYLDLILAVRVVENLTEAIDHIDRYGTHHTDVIVTADEEAAGHFSRDVDSAVVLVNASSRFTDGAEFGLGSEIGISTGKLHARGPCGIEALTTYKYVVRGDGQIRG